MLSRIASGVIIFDANKSTVGSDYVQKSDLYSAFDLFYFNEWL